MDRIIAGVQSRSVSRRDMIAENEQHYAMLRSLAKHEPDSEESKMAGKNGKLLRKALNEVALDQKLDKDIMKMLRDAQRKIVGQAYHLEKVLTDATIALHILAR